MKFKKIIALIMILSMLLGLVACGGDKEKNDGDNSSSKSDASALDWSAGADAADGEVTLNVTSWRYNDKAYYEEIIRRFEEKYDWITVDLRLTPDSSSYYTNLQADMMTGMGADVFDSHPGKLITYIDEGMAAPQTDFDYMENYSDEGKGVTCVDGQNYGYMNAYNYMGFIYNRAIFEKEGIKVPTTPEELVAAVNKLKKAGYGGVSYAGNQFGVSIANSVMYTSLGTEGYEAMAAGINNGSITNILDADGMQQVLDTLTYYQKEDIYYNAYESMSLETGFSLLAQQKTAITYGGTWAIGEKAAYFPNIDLGYFPVPTYANNGKSFADSAQISVINADSKVLGAAKLWVEFLASPEIAEYYCKNAQMKPSIKGIEITHEWEADSFSGEYVPTSNKSQFENYDFWGPSFEKVLENAVYAGDAWKKIAENYENELKTYDFKNK